MTEDILVILHLLYANKFNLMAGFIVFSYVITIFPNILNVGNANVMRSPSFSFIVI